MGYGDLQLFDIIIFAGIAIFLVFRLRKVLGKRVGFQKNPNNAPSSTKNAIKEENIKNAVPNLEEDFVELRKAYEAIEDFDHKDFFDGAKSAFETIINAFNSGDKKTLKNLLADKTYKIFEEAINKKNNDPESQIFSLNIRKIEKVSVVQDRITITIKFISEQFKNNDEGTIIKKEDLWSFEKPIKSKNPNWLLSST